MHSVLYPKSKHLGLSVGETETYGQGLCLRNINLVVVSQEATDPGQEGREPSCCNNGRGRKLQQQLKEDERGRTQTAANTQRSSLNKYERRRF